jgi:uncharacterized damage-inducible protein DinB
METYNATVTVISPEQLLNHWQGHRGLTRRVIEAFPEKELFEFGIGGMRNFAILAMEMVDLANPGIEGLVSGEWKQMDNLPHATGEGMPESKEELLALWDETTDKMNRLWPQLSPERFNESTKAFNMYDGTVISTILYFIDNEIHHRGQGYVYLRALGIEPPAFWDR